MNKLLKTLALTAGGVVLGTVIYVALSDRGWFNFARQAPSGVATTG